MDKCVRIAIIDNGINELSLRKKLENSIFIDSQGNCVVDTTIISQQRFQHGTNCAKIIEKNLKECSLYSIRILDHDGKGGISSLEPALEWCYENNIYLVNLSFGTTHFYDKTVIRDMVNRYANKGMLIIAASANSGYTSYPASFASVIGVIAGDKLEINRTLNLQQGIDFVAPCNYEIENEYGCFPVVKSNSYAAPYITALVGKMILENGFTNIWDIKSRIYECFCDKKNEYTINYTPDWMTSVWYDGVFRNSMVEPYFNVYFGNYEKYEEYIDTIIFKESDKFKEYKNMGKNLLYLGKEPLDIADFKGFYWDWKKRVKQIKEAERRKEDLQLPNIVLVLSKKIDLFWLLIELKNRFGKEGYNVYTVSTEVESILYDLQYIPEEIFFDGRENLHNFLYWQTYYQQSDAILSAVYACDADNLLNDINNIDVKVLLEFVDEEYYIEIQCDGQIREQVSVKQIDCNILFEDILNLLTEEENG